MSQIRKIRKRDATPLPAVERARTQFLVDLRAALGAAIADAEVTGTEATYPAAAVLTAVQKAADAIITEALATTLQTLETTPHERKREERHAMHATGTRDDVWQDIRQAVAERVQKSADAMTSREQADAIANFLDTPEEARLYERYLAAPPGRGTPPAPVLIQKGARAWAQIESAAQTLIQKSAGRLTPAQAVARFLETPAGRRLYQEYLAGP